MPLGAFKLNSISKFFSTIFSRTPIQPKVWATDDVQFHNFGKFGRSLWSPGTDGTLPLEVRDLGGGQNWHSQATTWEAWVYPTAWTANAATGEGSANVMGNTGSDGWIYNQFGFNNTGKLTFGYAYNASFSTYATVQEATASGVLNSWQHIAMVQNGGTITLYHNGIQKATASVTGTPGYDFGNVRGFAIGSTTKNFRGYLEEIRISWTARYSGSSFTVPSAPFVNDEYTKLLYHNNNKPLIIPNGSNISNHDDADSTYLTLDRYVNITPAGNAQISTAQSKFGGSSALFDGNGDYLEIQNISIGTGSFTIEFWFRIGNAALNQVFITSRSPDGTNGLQIGMFESKINFGTYGANIVTGNSNITTNTWHHYAVSRSGNSTKAFLNGIQYGNTAVDDYNFSNTTYWIGRGLISPFVDVNGHIDEFRISNTARYSTNFTPSTTPFNNDSYTLLLMHMNGANNSINFKDDSEGRFIQVSPAGNTNISTAQSKFGGSSAYFDGANDFIRVYSSNIISFGSNDFTIEFWFRPTGTKSGYPMMLHNFIDGVYNATNSWGIYDRSDAYANKVSFFSWNYNSFSSPLLYSTTSIVVDTWYHLAIVRNGDTWKLYLNGVLESTSTWSGSLDNNVCSNLGIGDWNSGSANPFKGWIDEMRISNTARYNGNFTPSTTAFANDSYTLLLMHMNDTNGSTNFIDDGSGTLESVTAVSLIDGSTSTASTIAIPAFALSNDYAILFDTSTTVTDVTPSGWTQISTVTTTGIRSSISYKKLLPTDLGSTITGMAGTTKKIMVIVRGNGPINSITLSTPVAQATTAIPTNQTISMAGVTQPVMGFAHYSSTGAISTRTGSGNTRELTSATSQYVKMWTYNTTASANQTIGMSDGGTNALQSFYIRFA